MGRTGLFHDERRISESPAEGYTIDDLSAMTGVPSRTIRFYQAKGALPPPERRGRMAYYGERHVERLKLVAQLQDRGLSLRAIRDLFERTEGGSVSVSEWLGVGDQLRAPWIEDKARVCDEKELKNLLGENARPGLIADLLRAGVLRREDTQPLSYFVPSVALLQIALSLEAAGVHVEVSQTGHDIMRRWLARAADEIAEYFVNRTGLSEGSPEEVSRSLEALRAVGIEAVRLIFAQEIERSLREMLEQGRAIPAKKKKRR